MYTFYCLFILLSTYSDSPLALLMGDFGKSLLPTISIIYFTVYCCYKKKIVISNNISLYFKIILWTIVPSLLSIIFLVGFGHGLYIKGEYIPIKIIKVTFQYISYGIYMMILSNLGSKLTVEKRFRPFYIGYILLFLIAVLEYSQLPNALEFLHYQGEFPYYRIRLLSYESSTTAITITIFFMLSLFYSISVKKSKIRTVILVVITCVQIGITGSKTLLGVVFIGVILFILFNVNKLNAKKIIINMLFIVLFVLLFLTIFETLLLSLTNDLQNYSSFATRFVSILAGIMVSIVVPIGTGTGAYLVLLPKCLNIVIPILKKSMPILNFSEIQIYLASEHATALTAKSGFIQGGFYWGIIGNVFLILWIFELCKKTMNYLKERKLEYNIIIRIAVILSVMQNILFCDFSMEFWTLIGILLTFSNDKEIF